MGNVTQKIYGPGNLKFYGPYVNDLYEALRNSRQEGQEAILNFSKNDIFITVDLKTSQSLHRELEKLDDEDGAKDNKIDKYLIEWKNRLGSRGNPLVLPYKKAIIQNKSFNLSNYIGHLLYKEQIFPQFLAPQPLQNEKENEFSITFFAALSRFNVTLIEKVIAQAKWPLESLFLYSSCIDEMGARSSILQTKNDVHKIGINLCSYDEEVTNNLRKAFLLGRFYHERLHRIINTYLLDQKISSVYELIIFEDINMKEKLSKETQKNPIIGNLLEDAVDYGLTPYYSPVRSQIRKIQYERWAQEFQKGDSIFHQRYKKSDTNTLILLAYRAFISGLYEPQAVEKKIDAFAMQYHKERYQEYLNLKEIFSAAHAFGASKKFREYISKLFPDFLKVK